ncbi:MAG TPA: hypothetical protein VFA20_20940 [Myxococcaceae bacterium]|nr:hypothetical protein [Myxococcaceae bacterium]
MIKVDDGELLSDILKWSVAGFGTAFEVAVPSFEPSGLFSRSMMQAAALGTRVRFFTRWPEEKDKQDALAQLMAHDVAVVIVPHLQAQAALLTDESTGLWYGWVEGVAFLGCGDAEAVLLRELLETIEDWERAASREVRRRAFQRRLN